MTSFKAVVIVGLLSSQLVTSRTRVDVTYDEIRELGADCNTSDNCEFQPKPDKLDQRNCNCGEFCADLGTCCVDSPYRSWNSEPIDWRITCSAVYGISGHQVFMIETCGSNWNADPYVESQCAADGESTSDPLLIVPVTSSRTGLTYRNYFCYRCNENDRQLPNFWLMRIEGSNTLTQDSSVPSIEFNKISKSWTMFEPKQNTFVSVSLRMEAPVNVSQHVKNCQMGLTSSCAPDWSDRVTKSKCSGYMGVVSISKRSKKTLYRNVHCALCNYENLNNLKCPDLSAKRTTPKRPLSFMRLVDVNESHGKIVGQTNRCNKQSIYDPFFKKCRVVTCAVSGHSVVNGQCVETNNGKR